MNEDTPNPLIDEHFDGNDDHIDALKNAVRTYVELLDLVSGMIEGGRLTRSSIPDDFGTLISRVNACVALNVEEPQDDD